MSASDCEDCGNALCICAEINARHCPVHNESDDKLRVYTNKIGGSLVNYVDFATYLKLEKENAELKAALGEALRVLKLISIMNSPMGFAGCPSVAREALAKLKKRWGQSAL